MSEVFRRSYGQQLYSQWSMPTCSESFTLPDMTRGGDEADPKRRVGLLSCN